MDGATSYHITYSSDNKQSWSLAALNHPDASVTIKDVENAKTYIVGVRARNDAGDSGWRNSEPAGPYTPPKQTPTPPVSTSTPALSFSATVADQSYTKDTAITALTLPRASKTSDGPSTTVGAIAYSLSPELPDGSVVRQRTTRAISGTPTATSTSATYIYTASMTGYDSASLSFAIEVTAPAPKPVDPPDTTTPPISTTTPSTTTPPISTTTPSTTTPSTTTPPVSTTTPSTTTPPVSTTTPGTTTSALSFGDATIADQSYIKDVAITAPDAAAGDGRERRDNLLPVPGASRRAIVRRQDLDDKRNAHGGQRQDRLHYTATDGTDSASLSFNIEVTEGMATGQDVSAQDGLSWVTSPTDQKWQQGTAVNLTMPAATGADHIVYSLVIQARAIAGPASRAILERFPPAPSTARPPATSAERYCLQRRGHQQGTHSNLIFMVADTTGNYPPYANINPTKPSCLRNSGPSTAPTATAAP